MKTNLQTERLDLKPVSAEDKAVLHEIFTDNFVKKYLFDDEDLPLSQVAEFIGASDATFGENGCGLWLLELKETGEQIGFAGLWTFFDEAQPQLLYGLLPAFTKKGLGSEAAQKIVEYSFETLGFEYLTASCDAPNTASHTVARNAGMEQFKEETIDGKPIVFFKIERKNWNND